MIAWIAWTAWALASCPVDAFTGPAPTGEVTVDLLAVGEDDAWAETGRAWIGRTITVTDLESTGSCWYSGRIVGNEDVWFYQMAFRPSDGAPTPVQSCPQGAIETERIVRGRRIRIAAIHPEDAYSSEAAALVGTLGVTSAGWSQSEAPCWYAGNFTAAGGEERYFYRVAVRSGDAPRTEATCPPGAAEGETLVSGTAVKIIAVHPDDPSYGDWARLVGTEGAAEGGLTVRDGCWLRGTVLTADRQRLRFERVAVWQPVERRSGPTATDRRLDGPRVPAGQRVRVVEIHTDDAYYAERERIVGLSCVTNEPLRRQESGFYSGELRCDDRRTRYFLKVAVQAAGFR